MNKGIVFDRILKKYNVKFYWVSKDFNKELNHPKGEIIFPVRNADLICEVFDLYNDDGYMPEELMLKVSGRDLNYSDKTITERKIKDKIKVVAK